MCDADKFPQYDPTIKQWKDGTVEKGELLRKEAYNFFNFPLCEDFTNFPMIKYNRRLVRVGDVLLGRTGDVVDVVKNGVLKTHVRPWGILPTVSGVTPFECYSLKTLEVNKNFFIIQGYSPEGLFHVAMNVYQTLYDQCGQPPYYLRDSPWYASYALMLIVKALGFK